MTTENENTVAAPAEPVKQAKTPARPGSRWATGKRANQKGFTQKQGFARGARVK
jgi:hypothetical protein